MSNVEVATQKIGQLLVELGLVSHKDLNEALQIGKETGLPIGKVLTMSAFVTDVQFQAAVHAQSMLKDELIDLDIVRKAMELVTLNSLNFNDALLKLGWKNSGEGKENKLGRLLSDADFATEDQLDGALKQSEVTGLPIGRLLVLSGAVTASLLAAALTAQALVRDKKIKWEQAIEALKLAKRRQVPLEQTLSEKGFYELPPRNALHLDELLTGADILSESEVMNYVEIGLLNDKLVGQVLVEQKVITQSILEAVLQIQQMVADETLTRAQAYELLSKMHHDGISLEAALKIVKASKTEPQESITLVQFLKYVSAINDADVEKVLHFGLRESKIFAEMLKLSGVLDEKTIIAGQLCASLIKQRVLSIERACIVFDYAKRKGLSVESALKELRWDQPNATQTSAKQKQSDSGNFPPNELKKAHDNWDEVRKLADQAFEQGIYDEAEKLWMKALQLGEQLGDSDPRFAYSLDRLTETLTQLKRYDQAEHFLTRSYELKLRILGPSHTSIAATLNNLSKLHYFQGKYSEAEPFAKRFIELCEQTFGPEHPDVACGVQNLATLYHTSGKFDLAEEQYKKALGICRKTLGVEHPATVRLLKSYASLLKATHREAEAKHLDACAEGIISGTWKVISLRPDELLGDPSS